MGRPRNDVCGRRRNCRVLDVIASSRHMSLPRANGKKYIQFKLVSTAPPWEISNESNFPYFFFFRTAALTRGFLLVLLFLAALLLLGPPSSNGSVAAMDTAAVSPVSSSINKGSSTIISSFCGNKIFPLPPKIKIPNSHIVRYTCQFEQYLPHTQNELRAHPNWAPTKEPTMSCWRYTPTPNRTASRTSWKLFIWSFCTQI